MSIMLRKACQPILDGVGLNNYHVDIADRAPYRLQVVGECGKPLIIAYGITFDRKSPSAANIEYAVELFDAFITKHLDKIRVVLKAQQALQTKPGKITEHPTEKINISSSYSGAAVIGYKDGIKYRLIKRNDNNEYRLYFNNEEDIDAATYKSLPVIKLDYKFIQKMGEFLDDYVSISKEEAAVEELMQSLNTCTI